MKHFKFFAFALFTFISLAIAGGSATVGFTSVKLASSTVSAHQGRSSTWGPSDEQFGSGFAGSAGTVSYGTQTATFTRAGVYVWKAVSGSFTNIWVFEGLSNSDIIDLADIETDSTGKLSIALSVNGAVKVSPTLSLSCSTFNIYCVIIVQISPTGVITGFASTNAANIIPKDLFLDANNGMTVTGFGSGAVTLAGQSLNLGTGSGFLVRLSSAGAGIGSLKGFTNFISGCYNSFNGLTYVTGQSSGSNLVVASYSAAGTTQSSIVTSFSAGATSISSATGYSIVCLGTVGVHISGDFRTDAGVTLSLGSVTRTSSVLDTLTAAFDTSLNVLSSNQGNAVYDGHGYGLVKSTTGAVWGAGGLFGGAGTFSGFATPNYGSTKNDLYVSSISASGSSYANVSVADVSAAASAVRYRGMSMSLSSKILFVVDVIGSVKFGTLSASVKSGQQVAIVVYTL